MKISALVKTAAVVQLARLGLNRRRRTLQRRQRRNRGWGLLGMVAGAGAAWWALSQLRAEEAPAWPNRKKQRKEARRAEAARRAHEQAARPPEVHVEKDAQTELKAPLGELLQ
jgi:hypothetical protein